MYASSRILLVAVVLLAVTVQNAVIAAEPITFGLTVGPDAKHPFSLSRTFNGQVLDTVKQYGVDIDSSVTDEQTGKTTVISTLKLEGGIWVRFAATRVTIKSINVDDGRARQPAIDSNGTVETFDFRVPSHGMFTITAVLAGKPDQSLVLNVEGVAMSIEDIDLGFAVHPQGRHWSNVGGLTLGVGIRPRHSYFSYHAYFIEDGDDNADSSDSNNNDSIDSNSASDNHWPVQCVGYAQGIALHLFPSTYAESPNIRSPWPDVRLSVDIGQYTTEWPKSLAGTMVFYGLSVNFPITF